MVVTDAIADFLTRIRNANMVMHETVEAPSSKINYSDRKSVVRERV